jgi:hypothetical protein
MIVRVKGFLTFSRRAVGYVGDLQDQCCTSFCGNKTKKGPVMIRKLAIVLAVAMIGILAWHVVGPGDAVSIQVNGRELTGPFDAIVGVWGLIVAAVTLFCVAILLAFVFAGVALLLLGVFALVGLILAAVGFPFLLPILIPLFLLWLFCVLVRPPRPPRQRA